MGNPPAKNHFFHFRRAVDNSLSTPVFREAISAHLCLSSPALREGGWVGRQVGTRGVVIDMFGDSVLCCKEIPGDSAMTRSRLQSTRRPASPRFRLIARFTANSLTSCQLPCGRRVESCSGDVAR